MHTHYYKFIIMEDGIDGGWSAARLRVARLGSARLNKSYTCSALAALAFSAALVSSSLWRSNICCFWYSSSIST
jgi:hypothetical protein